MNKISFGIYANQTDKRWNTFIEEMIALIPSNGKLYYADDTAALYGIDKNFQIRSSYFRDDYETIITLDDYFAEGSVYRVVKPTFKRGDRILVWSLDYNDAQEVIALTYIEGVVYPVIAVQNGWESEFLNGTSPVDTSTYRFWKPIPTERQKLQQEIEQLEKELNIKREKLKEYGKGN